jgi:trimethylamine--corrinoid protein Co-methyltransferase
MKKFAFAPRLTLLDDAGIQRVHEAATRILHETGLNVHHLEMRGQLADHGARLGDGVRVYLPPEMIQRALASARHDVIVYSRDGQPAMRLGPHQIYFGTGSDLLYWRTSDGKRVPASLANVGQAARLCDALGEVDFVMSCALPHDEGMGEIEPAQFYAMTANTVKPSIMTSFSSMGQLERVHEMACLVAGGDAAFRQKPNYILYGQFVSPLQHDLHAVERLLFCADHEVPLIYIPTIMPGASGPVTLAGSLALAVAESLAGLVMQQVRRPGAPFIFGACVSALDLHTMHFLYGSPEWRLNDLVMAEMSRHYGLPVFGTGAASDAKWVDAQAGAEYAQSLLIAAMAGTNLIHDVGYLDSGVTGSLESIVLGADVIKWTKSFLNGLEIDDASLALDVVRQVGPGMQFLDHDHTLAHFRKSLMAPYAMIRTGHDQWREQGGRDYAAAAGQKAQNLLETHEPLALEAGLDTELRRLAGIASKPGRGKSR